MSKTIRTCDVELCERQHYAKGWCSMHYMRVRNGKPLGTWEEQPRGKPSTNPAGLGYRAMHYRIARVRGAARIYLCIDCGDQAQEWSLSKSAVDVHVSEATNSAGKEYSLDVYDYEPRCMPCHRKHDGIAPSPQARKARWEKAA